jgi:DUSP domain
LIYDLIDQANQKNYMNEEFLPVNIISMDWFKKWKRAHFFHEFSHEKPEDIEEEYEEEDDEDNENKKTTLEPITNQDILSNEDFLKDPDYVKSYCNSVLKEGLTENKDFIIVPQIVWKTLHRIYGGNEIKRLIVSVNDDSNLPFIAIWLKKVKNTGFFIVKFLLTF